MSSNIQTLHDEQKDLIKVYKQLFSTPNGKKVLEDLKDTFCERTSIVPGDPYMTHANEGAREVVLYITENIKMEVD